jgi:hypothetical protein
MSLRTPDIARGASDRIVRLLAVIGFVLGCGAALGACSKCDVPTWQPDQSAPRSCHATPSPQ